MQGVCKFVNAWGTYTLPQDLWLLYRTFHIDGISSIRYAPPINNHANLIVIQDECYLSTIKILMCCVAVTTLTEQLPLPAIPLQAGGNQFEPIRYEFG